MVRVNPGSERFSFLPYSTPITDFPCTRLYNITDLALNRAYMNATLVSSVQFNDFLKTAFSENLERALSDDVLNQKSINFFMVFFRKWEIMACSKLEI